MLIYDWLTNLVNNYTNHDMYRVASNILNYATGYILTEITDSVESYHFLMPSYTILLCNIKALDNGPIDTLSDKSTKKSSHQGSL